MPKYTRLSPSELKELEKEFIEFLVINGITADDWVQLKEDEIEKAEKIIDHFSDVIWEGVLRKTSFLETRSQQEIMTFQCLEDKLILMGLKIDDPSIDLTTQEGNDQVEKLRPETKLFTQEKKYQSNRERELFDMIQNGCTYSDGKLFKTIALALVEE